MNVYPMTTIAISEQHATSLLDFAERPSTRTLMVLMDEALLKNAISELQQALASPPASADEARSLIANLIGSFPEKPHDAEAYAVAMAAEAELWSTEIVAEACWAITRSMKHLPTVADLAERCGSIMGRRNLLLRGALLQQDEHRRRDDEAARRARYAARRSGTGGDGA